MSNLIKSALLTFIILSLIILTSCNTQYNQTNLSQQPNTTHSILSDAIPFIVNIDAINHTSDYIEYFGTDTNNETFYFTSLDIVDQLNINDKVTMYFEPDNLEDGIILIVKN